MDGLRAKIRGFVALGMTPRVAREMALVELGLPKGYRDPQVRDILLPTGQELFDRMTPAEQDEALGPEAAEAIRTGQASLADLRGVSPQATTPDILTQRPISELLPQTKNPGGSPNVPDGRDN